MLRLLQTDTHRHLLSPFSCCPRLYKEEPPRGGIALLPLSTGHTSYASHQTEPARRKEKTGALQEEQATPKRAQARLVGFRAVQPPSFAPLFLQFFPQTKGDLLCVLALDCPPVGLAKAIFLASHGLGPVHLLLSLFLYYSNGRLFRELIMLGSLGRLF